MNTRRIERSPGGGGHTVTIGGVKQWVPGDRAAAEAVVLADLCGTHREVALAILERGFDRNRWVSEVEVSITVQAVR